MAGCSVKVLVIASLLAWSPELPNVSHDLTNSVIPIYLMSKYSRTYNTLPFNGYF